MNDVVIWWGLALVLVSLAGVAGLHMPARGWRAAVVGMVALSAVVGVGVATFLTWSRTVLTEDELYAAAESVSDQVSGDLAGVTEDRLMWALSKETGQEILAERQGEDVDYMHTYQVSARGASNPAVCVTLTGPELWETSPPWRVDRGACDD